jgi:hypothetical protein
MQRCTHSHSQHHEIPNIHAYYSIMTCVSPASNAGGSEVGWSVKGVGVWSVGRGCGGRGAGEKRLDLRTGRDGICTPSATYRTPRGNAVNHRGRVVHLHRCTDFVTIASFFHSSRKYQSLNQSLITDHVSRRASVGPKVVHSTEHCVRLKHSKESRLQ